MSTFFYEIDLEKLVVGGDSPIHRLDARVKFLSTFALVFGVILLKHIAILLFIFFSVTLISFAIKISLRTYIKRLFPPFSIAVVVLIIVLFTYGGKHQISSFFELPIYEESFSFASLLFARIITSISILNVFVATTPMRETIEAMLWFKVPKVVVDIAVMMMRYVHLLSEEATRMYHAQASRCGFSKRIGCKQKMKNLSTIAGSLIIRALKRGERVYIAMLSRGYTLDSHILESERLSAKDVFICVSAILITVLIVIIDRIGGFGI